MEERRSSLMLAGMISTILYPSHIYTGVPAVSLVTSAGYVNGSFGSLTVTKGGDYRNGEHCDRAIS